ncbi:gliding motility-associated C-terminal domain-containing protein [Chitinophaga caseinilytica]|uniref:T9SS type B sorting domain-containing protein n=1 Tax=Chitinophaga caseinilytica TaxID=2267521 RepID=UPI003C2BACE9
MAPDTVCVGTPVNITDQSAGVGTWFWNFCSGSLYQTPTLTSVGNGGGNFNGPAHSVIVQEGGNYYVFVTNNYDRNFTRLDFGNSLLNTPTATSITNMTSIIPANAEGVQAVEDATGKHLIIVGGNSFAVPKIVRIDFGASWANTPTTGADWGNNSGTLAYPYELVIFQDGAQYFGFATNQQNSTLTRFEFGTNFSGTPNMVNMGNFGGLLNSPYGLQLTKEGPNWHMFVVNQNHHLVRFDFGTSLLNTPTAADLGDLGGMLSEPRDLALFQDCGETFLLIVNNGNNTLVRADFPGGLTTAPTATSLGNPGGLIDFPAGISGIFRTGTDLNAFLTDVGTTPANAKLTRISMTSCNNSSIPNFTGQTPPSFTYNQPGTYKINLLTDEGTPNQRTFCKNIVVLPVPTVELGQNNIVICNGSPVSLDAGPGPNFRYSWTNGEDDRAITVTGSGTFGVSVFNGGCTVTDAIDISITSAVVATGTVQDVDCNHATGEVQLQVSGGTAPYAFRLNGGASGTVPEFKNLAIGNHVVNVTDDNGCSGLYNFAVTRDLLRTLTTSATSNDPSCFGSANGSILAQVSQGTAPLQFALNNGAFGNSPDFQNLGAGSYKVYIRNAYCLDSQQVTLVQPDALMLPYTAWQDTCNRLKGWVDFSPQGGVAPYSLTWNGNVVNNTEVKGLGVGIYSAQLMDANGCQRAASIYVPNLNLGRMSILTPDTIVSIGDAFTLRAGNAADYIWSPVTQGNIACPVCPETPARPLVATQYIVRTLTGANCIAADTVNVMIDYSSMLAMPNAFSPNKDGVNDVFRPKSKAVMAFSMQIYNRTGNLLFTTTDHRKGWDGTHNGEPQPIGTYVYVIRFGFWQADGKLELQDKKGTFDLIR